MFEDEYDEIIARALAAGVAPILAVGTDLATSLQAVSVAARFRSVFAAVGLHPHAIDRFHQDAESIQELMAAPKVVAVGEIGLDYVRGADTKHAQLEAFAEQLSWAAVARLPVSVHNRDADEDIMRLLNSFDGTAVLHCFSGGAELAARALAGGHYLSFAGNLTFPRAEQLRAVASAIPLDRALVETDSPVLAPQKWRGRRNEPAHVVATAEQLAALHAEPWDTFTSTVAENATNIFHWSEN